MIPKYRAWLKDEKTMHEVISIDFHNESVDVKDNVSAMPWHNYDEGGNAILMQSTGLTDTNGVEIFEGDILRVCDDDGVHNEPVFRDGQALVMNVTYQDFDVSAVAWALDCYHGSDDDDNEYPVVVGNIHQNPELLEI